MTTKDWTDLEGEDVIDSRDLIEAAQALRDELEEEEREPTEDEARFLAEFDAAERTGIEDFPYGAALIQVKYFTEYARQLADALGAIDREADWPLAHIDWEAAADALKQDYADVVLFETTYYARA
jgi:hypothetical protein